MSKRPLRRWIARGLLAVMGWKPEGTRPDVDRYVLIAAPHTTNWDFPFLMIFAAYFDLDIRWMGKRSLFRPPLGWIMTLLGGIPITRHRRESVVAAMVRAFTDRNALGLVVAAEGSRSRRDYWKSGFYHIATGAEVPIILSYLDYTRKVGGFGPAFHPTGDVCRDMDQIREFYAGKDGKFPERFGPIRLREEEAARDPDLETLEASG